MAGPVDLIRDLTPAQMWWLLIELAGKVSEDTFRDAVRFAVVSAPQDVAS